MMALKNKMLYDLALMPNLESDVIELRRWLGNRRKRNRLTGHFGGLYGPSGQYGFQFGGEDCQGESFSHQDLRMVMESPSPHGCCLNLGMAHNNEEVV